MDNNDILRRLRFTFDLDDNSMMKLFKLGNMPLDRATISSYLKREGVDDYLEMNDKALASFLNGLIIDKRGQQEGREPIAEEHLTNNLILKKIKIALSLTTDDIVAVFKVIDKKITASEIGAFLRNPNHNKYREFNGQYLRNLLYGLQTQYLQNKDK